MDARTVNQTYDLLALAGGYTSLRKAGKYYIGPCPFCGGKDRFTMKLNPTGWKWHCRQCSNDGYHTPIDFVMRLEDVDFKTALRKLGGDVATPSKHAPVPPPQPTRKPIDLPSVEWQADGLKQVTAWSTALTDDPDAQAGRDYLSSRGIHRGTWDAFLLGHTVDSGRPAITIPWMDIDGLNETLFAVKYRYIHNGKQRYGAVKGSKPLVFGLHQLTDIDNTLMIVEGEFNAMSIWQCQPSRVGVLSVGSEGGGHLDFLRFLSKRFKRVDVWLDDKEKAARLAHDLQHPHTSTIYSLVIDGVKYDANELLKIGALADFLADRYKVPCWGKTLEELAGQR